MSWNDERVEKLQKLWAEGQSASQIAKELGGVTRNAVIGKVHRLGLSNRHGPAATQAKADTAPDTAPDTRPRTRTRTSPAGSATPAAEEKPATPPAGQPAQTTVRSKQIIPAGQPLPPQPSANEIDPEALAKVSEVEKKALILSLMQLTERTCKWPVGDPATEDFWFCGLPAQPGKPYCEAHVGVAFQPMSARRDRKR